MYEAHKSVKSESVGSTSQNILEERNKAMAARLTGAWKLIFEIQGLKFFDEEEINPKHLKDPQNKYVKAILKIYSLETWLRGSLS